jgi:hypothetical protein
MTSTLPRRTAAITALAVTAFSGVALAEAGAAGAHPRANTSLSIRSNRTVINPGGSDAISGDLRAGRGDSVFGRKVSLLARAVGTTTWASIGTHLTGRHGAVGFEVTPSVSTRYRLVFAGNGREQAAHSGVVGVRVGNTTSLTISVASKSIAPGASDAVDGVLSLDNTAIAGDTVKLHAQSGKHASVIATAVTAADGSVSFPVTPKATTHYVLTFAGTAADRKARSAVATIHVLRPSSLSIRARSNQKKALEIITGDLRGGGHGLFHRTVTLRYRASGSTTWTSTPGKFTSKSGGVGFSVPAPTADEDYQLVFAGGPLYDPSVSGVVTVSVPSVS